MRNGRRRQQTQTHHCMAVWGKGRLTFCTPPKIISKLRKFGLAYVLLDILSLHICNAPALERNVIYEVKITQY